MHWQDAVMLATMHTLDTHATPSGVRWHESRPTTRHDTPSRARVSHIPISPLSPLTRNHIWISYLQRQARQQPPSRRARLGHLPGLLSCPRPRSSWLFTSQTRQSPVPSRLASCCFASTSHVRSRSRPSSRNLDARRRRRPYRRLPADITISVLPAVLRVWLRRATRQAELR